MVSESSPPRVSLVILLNHSCSLLLVGIQGLPCGGQCRTRGLCHSTDVLIQYGGHPCQHPITILTPFTPNNINTFGAYVPFFNEIYVVFCGAYVPFFYEIYVVFCGAYDVLSDFKILCVQLSEQSFHSSHIPLYFGVMNKCSV